MEYLYTAFMIAFFDVNNADNQDVQSRLMDRNLMDVSYLF